MAFITPKNIPKLIIILPIIGILITTLLLSGVTIYTIKSNFEKEKKSITQSFFENLQKTTKQRVELTYNIIDALYKNQKNYSQTIKIMQQVLEKMRWEKKGYIFVFDYHGNTLYHPNHYYMTINRWNFERNGVKVIRLLIQEALKHPNGTYVKYLAYNPDGSPKEKVSFVKIYKPLNIVIGNGVYLDYLDTKLIQKQKEQTKLLYMIIIKLILISLSISIIMMLIMYLFSRGLKNMVNRYNQDLIQERRKLFLKANFDNLTGVHNRTHFLLEVNSYIYSSKKFAILFLDLDGFKNINDTVGHNIGDEVLKTIAQRLKKIITDNDIISRFGGDEFLILINNHNNIEDILDKILSEIKKPIIIDNKEYKVSASIGVSIYPDNSTDINELIKQADIAMYEAKKSGKDKYIFYKG